MKELFVFDFDDTLIYSKSRSIITDKQTGVVVRLTSAEFKDHKIDYEKFDYDLSEYDDLPNQFTINKFIFNEMLTAIQTKDCDIVILTARHNPTGPLKFLKIYDLDDAVEVVAMGKNADIPRGKSNWIKNRLLSNQYDIIHFWDDNEYNIQFVQELQLQFSNVVFDVNHVP